MIECRSHRDTQRKQCCCNAVRMNAREQGAGRAIPRPTGSDCTATNGALTREGLAGIDHELAGGGLDREEALRVVDLVRVHLEAAMGRKVIKCRSQSKRA